MTMTVNAFDHRILLFPGPGGWKMDDDNRRGWTAGICCYVDDHRAWLSRFLDLSFLLWRTYKRDAVASRTSDSNERAMSTPLP